MGTTTDVIAGSGPIARSWRQALGRPEGREARSSGTLDAVAAPDEHLGDHRGGKEPVIHDARDGRERGGKLAGVAHLARVVGDHPAVGAGRRAGAGRDLAELGVQPRQGRGEPERVQLQRDREPRSRPRSSRSRR